MDKNLVPAETPAGSEPAKINLLDAVKQAEQGVNPFKQKAEPRDLKASPWAGTDVKGSPWNPRPGDPVPAVPDQISVTYRDITPQKLTDSNPKKLVINDFPTTDRLRPSRDEKGYFFYFESDKNTKYHLPSNLTEIEIWQNGNRHELSVASLKRSVDDWVATGKPDLEKDKGKDKDVVVKTDPGKTKNPYIHGRPPGSVPDWTPTPGPEDPKGTNWSLVGTRVLGGASGATSTLLASTRDIFRTMNPEVVTALTTERSALLPLATTRQQVLAGELRGALPAGDMLRGMRIETWPTSHLNPTQAAQQSEWMALDRLVTNVRRDTWGGPRFAAADHAAAVSGDAALGAAYQRYAGARTNYESTLAARAEATSAAYTRRMQGNIGAILASEGGKAIFDKFLLSDTPSSWRTTICDTASPLVMFSSSLPWYGKAGIMLGTHAVNRYLDYRFNKPS